MTDKLPEETIQGNITPGFKKDHQAFVLVSFADRSAARTWLRELVPEIASAAEVAAFNTAYRLVSSRLAGDEARVAQTLSASWTNVALSWAGLACLLGRAEVERFPSVFKNNRVPWSEMLADDGASSVHAVVILASDRPADLDALLARQRELLRRTAVSEIRTFRGGTLPGDLRGYEHFGFKDGISQPVLSGTSDAAMQPASADTPAGEVLLGELDATGAPAASGPEWTRHGSYLAFLQLQQHVGAFRAAMQREAERLGVAPVELAGSLVGRAPDGQLLLGPHRYATRAPDGQLLLGPPRYAARGPDGQLVLGPPRLSHVGRAHPYWLPRNQAARHRLVRRGIPYGTPLANGEPDDGERGLLFVSYQADIERQFEHVWSDWLNGPDFPGPGAGRDGLVGQHSDGTRLEPNRPGWRQPAQAAGSEVAQTRLAATTLAAADGARGPVTTLQLPRFVTPRYGTYFFSPSLPALTFLGSANS